MIWNVYQKQPKIDLYVTVEIDFRVVFDTNAVHPQAVIAVIAVNKMKKLPFSFIITPDQVSRATRPPCAASAGVCAVSGPVATALHSSSVASVSLPVPAPPPLSLTHAHTLLRPPDCPACLPHIPGSSRGLLVRPLSLPLYLTSLHPSPLHTRPLLWPEPRRAIPRPPPPAHHAQRAVQDAPR